MDDYKKLLFETMPLDELDQRVKAIGADIHKRQAALDKEKKRLDKIIDIYVQRVQLDKEWKQALESIMKSL